tara:strand:- start:145 stop:528 length:384 start_codon:yes stop_codon:yes gene_type:complete
MTSIFKFTFYTLTLFLIVLSLFPGSLIGFLLYGDLGRQPDFIENPFGTTINHFIFYVLFCIFGFFIHIRSKNFKNLFYLLFFLAALLEIIHLIVPNRAFQIGDLIGNILGVLVAYSFAKIYLLINKT